MMTATYFGEITELDSRAVWYSDEEDDDDDDNLNSDQGADSRIKPLEPVSSESIRSKCHINFRRVSPNPNIKFSSCIVSQLSSAQYKNFKLNETSSLILLGSLNVSGKAFACPVYTEDLETVKEYILWLLFDSNGQGISGYEVNYFAESLRDHLYNEFNLDHSGTVLILSQQFSGSENVEYLTNYTTSEMRFPFAGQPLLSPSLIKNQLEASLFEQLTLTLKSALVVCLPNPKNFWFDKTKSWPSIPNEIIEHKLKDDNLERTLIFT